MGRPPRTRGAATWARGAAVHVLSGGVHRPILLLRRASGVHHPTLTMACTALYLLWRAPRPRHRRRRGKASVVFFPKTKTPQFAKENLCSILPVVLRATSGMCLFPQTPLVFPLKNYHASQKELKTKHEKRYSQNRQRSQPTT